MIYYAELCITIYAVWFDITAKFVRGIAQLVEHRSPKPSVEGSNPSAPASNKRAVRMGGFFVVEKKAKVRNRKEGLTSSERRA